MRKEQQLLKVFKGLNLADNLAAASSATATLGQLSATQQNATAASSAAAVMAQLAGTHQYAAAASSAAAAIAQLSATQHNAAVASSAAVTMAQLSGMQCATADISNKEEIAQQQMAMSPVEAVVAGAAAAAGDSAATASDAMMEAAPGLGSLLAALTSRVGKAMQQVLPNLAANFNMRSSEAAVEGSSSNLLDPAAVLEEMRMLQQRLPSHHDKASMLQDYQAWLDQVKECLVQQHDETQVSGSL